MLEVGRSYPVSSVAPRALLELGRTSEAAGKSIDAASAYKRLLAIAAEDGLKARALWGLGSSYEARGYRGPALDAYRRALALYPAVDLGPLGVEGTVASLVEAKLARPEFARLGEGGPGASLPLPMIRRRDGDRGSGRPIVAEGVPPAPGLPRVFEAVGGTIRPSEPEGSEASWTVDLGGEPTWVGYLAGRLLAASAVRLVALDPEEGLELWSYSPLRAGGRLDPFARDDDPGLKSEASGRLHGFQTLGDRLIVLRGDRELLALDAETGAPDWSYRPEGGGIGNHLLVTPSRVALQIGEPPALVVLDPETGQTRPTAPGLVADGNAERSPSWRQPPVPIDDDRVAVALGPRRVALLDLSRGDEVWSYNDDSALPRLEPARLLADSGRLFALFGGNHLVRLDPSTGDSLWERPLGPGDLGSREGALVVEGGSIFAAIDGAGAGKRAKLAAFDAETGGPIWSRALVGPDSGWSIAPASNCLAAYPSPTRPGSGVLDFLPVFICEKATGAPIQRLLFPASGGASAVRLDLRPALVATPAGLWSLVPPGDE